MREYQNSLPPNRKKGLLLITNILNDHLEKEGVSDESEINYVNMINELMIGPMKKMGSTWEDILHSMEWWNDTLPDDNNEDYFYPVDPDIFKDTLLRFWDLKI